MTITLCFTGEQLATLERCFRWAALRESDVELRARYLHLVNRVHDALVAPGATVFRLVLNDQEAHDFRQVIGASLQDALTRAQFAREILSELDEADSLAFAIIEAEAAERGRHLEETGYLCADY